VTGSILLNRTDEVSRELINDIQPSRVPPTSCRRPRDQETATRGYAIAADRQFLDPYYDGNKRRRPPRTPSANASPIDPT